jgi:hypothetical protein
MQQLGADFSPGLLAQYNIIMSSEPRTEGAVLSRCLLSSIF